jgi:DNA (cytosine-5)-methyltransferase 1
MKPTTMVDLFCGAGGANIGTHLALEQLGISEDDVRAHAINHWDLAIAVHGLNMPWISVHQQDITRVSAKTYHLRDIDLLFAAPSCVHHSRARGGKPRSNQQRSHAWEVLERWIEKARVKVFLMENVPEWRDWGPLDPDHQPIKVRKGEYFRAFMRRLVALGYTVDWRILCAADYGDPTTRRRFFLQAVCDGRPIVWPEPTHRDPRKPAKPGEEGLPPWRAAAECIDWSLPCPSIFDRKRPLAEATLRRIATGIVRFVLNGKPFLVTCNHSDPSFRGQGVDQPFGTITASHDARGVVVPMAAPFVANTSHTGTTGRASYVYDPRDPLRTITGNHNGHAVVQPFLATMRGTDPSHIKSSARPVGEPMRTVSASGTHHALVTPFIAGLAHGAHKNGERESDRCRHIEEPLTTIHAGGGNHALVTPFLAGVGGRMGQGHTSTRSAEGPMPTLTTKADAAIIAPTLIQTSYGERRGQAPRVLDLEQPLGTVVAGGQKHGLVAAFVSKHYGGPGALEKQPPGLDPRSPMGTVTAQDKHSLVTAELGPATTERAKLVAAFILKYYGHGGSQTPADPMHTITTIARLGLVTVEIEGANYVVTDIGLRMLEPRELALAMGFPAWYRWERADGSPLSKRDAVKMIGNACPVNTVKEIIKAVVLERPKSYGLEAVA